MSFSNSSLHSFSFSFSGEPANVQLIDTQDLEKLRQQVHDYEELVQVLQMQIEERRGRYKESLDKLRKSRETDAEKYEKDLEQQEIEQKLEYNEKERKLNAQYDALHRTALNAQTDIELWKQTHDTIKEVKAEMRNTTNQQKALDNENTVILAAITDAAQAETLTQTKKEKSKSLQEVAKELENDVTNYRQNISFQNEKYRTILNEIGNTIQSQQTYFDLTKQKIIREMQKRDKFFGKHIQIVEQTIQQEVRQTEYDLQYVESQVKTMYAIKKETSKRCNTLMSRFTKDIQKMKLALDEAGDPASNEDSLSLSQSRSDSMMRQRDSLKQQEMTLYAELQKVSNDISRCADVLKEMVNAEKVDSFRAYSSMYE